MSECDGVRVGDWVLCNLPALTALYGSLAQVIDLRRPDQGVMVSFPPQQSGWKPMLTALSDGHWTLVEDVVTRLATIVSGSQRT